jgi:hypothetical protein
MIDRVVFHGASQTTLVQGCLAEGPPVDALLLGRPLHVPIHNNLRPNFVKVLT